MKELSDRQREILSYISGHIERAGIAPSLEDISSHFSFSPAAAHYAVEALVRKGFLEKDEGKMRALRLTGGERDERENLPIPLFQEEPFPSEIGMETERRCYVPRKVGRHGAFAFIVRSESMRDGGILPGDTAIVSTDASMLSDGSIVLADPGDGNERMELRRYRKLPGYVLLIPDNAIMGVRKSNSVTVYGILISIRRDYGSSASRA